MPMRQAQFTFWFLRGPYDRSDNGLTNMAYEKHRYWQLKDLTPANIRNLKHIQCVMQMFEAETLRDNERIKAFLPKDLLERGMNLKVFHITIRQSDWWNWELGEPPRLDERWVQSLLDAPQLGGVGEFRLELETLERNRDQLDNIVDRLRRLEGKPKLADPCGSDRQTTSTFRIKSPPRVWHWSRSSKLDNKDWPVFGDLTELKLHVVVLSWRNEQNTAETRTQKLCLAMDEWARKLDRIESSLGMPYAGGITPRRLDALRRHERASLLSQDRWTRMAFPTKAQMCWIQSVQQANSVHTDTRYRFETMMGDMEAKRLTRKWEHCGSLLKFEGLDS